MSVSGYYLIQLLICPTFFSNEWLHLIECHCLENMEKSFESIIGLHPIFVCIPGKFLEIFNTNT